MDFAYADFMGLLLFLIICISVFFNYIINNRKLTAFQAISVAFALFYAFVPYLVRHFEIKVSLLSFDASTHFLAQLWAFGGYIVYFIFYQITKIVSRKSKTLEIDIKEDPKKFTLIQKVTNIIFAVALICNFYFYINMGGILSALSMAESLRGNVEFSRFIYEIPFLSLSRMLMPLITIASYMYLYFISKGISRYRLKFIISTVMVVIYVIFNAGKLYLILTVVSYLLFFSFGKSKRVVFKMCVLAIFALVIIEPLNNLFYSLEYGFSNSGSLLEFGSFAEYFKEFVFPYSNLLHVRSFVDNNGLRWGYDYIAIFVDILPSSVLNAVGINEPLASHVFNTYNYTGGVWTAGTPTDLITLGYYQLREFGILIICMIWGVISALFDKNLKWCAYEKGDFLIRVRALFFFFQLVPYADPSPLWRNRLDYLFFVFLIIYIARNRKHVLANENKLINEGERQ